MLLPLNAMASAYTGSSVGVRSEMAVLFLRTNDNPVKQEEYQLQKQNCCFNKVFN